MTALPKYRKHKQSGQAIVTLNGRDHLLGPHNTRASRLQYDRLIAEWLASGRSASFGTVADELSIAELAVDYLRHAKSYYGTGPTSEYGRLPPALRPLRELYGESAACRFGPLQLKALRQRYVDLGWSRTYVNQNTRRIIRMFRWAVGEGLLYPTTAQALAMVPGLRRHRTTARETEPVRPVEDAVVEATLPHLPPIVADMVRIQRLTGCRPGEVCLLRPGDVDASGDVWLYRPHRHKTAHHGRDRVILIGPQAQAILRPYLDRAPKTYCFRPCDSMAHHLAQRSAARTTPLSCGNRPGSNRRRRPRKQPGEAYSVDSYRRAIARGCDLAFPHPQLGRTRRTVVTANERVELQRWQSARRWAPNQLRHAAATQVRREFGLEAAQVVLGHSTAEITQVYAERDLAKGADVARRIG
ncbi:MAG TPA: site-specific integrase [Lacipirellulaceae bacterium]|nr:site-specific integrase [Lacipirellulaceae bacterium]